MAEIPAEYLTASYDYELPEELIAHSPASSRDGSRMMLVSRRGGERSHHHFSDLPSLLRGDEIVVLNDTRVIPARIWGRKESGGRVEVFGLGPWATDTTLALVRASKTPKVGQILLLGGDPGVRVRVAAVLEEGRCQLTLEEPGTWLDLARQLGEMPLPPYIQRLSGRSVPEDFERYQTVYSSAEGAVAAPTAGLHFTPEILDRLGAMGCRVVKVTLHVGLGTFRPVRVEDVRTHPMDSEVYDLSPDAARIINEGKQQGRPVLAVGTTVVRTLESAADPESGLLVPGSRSTDIFIHPPKEPRFVDQMLTNFHLPCSTLIMLVASFCGRENILEAYRNAVELGYRFYSYGDCMLVR